MPISNEFVQGHVLVKISIRLNLSWLCRNKVAIQWLVPWDTGSRFLPIFKARFTRRKYEKSHFLTKLQTLAKPRALIQFPFDTIFWLSRRIVSTELRTGSGIFIICILFFLWHLLHVGDMKKCNFLPNLPNFGQTHRLDKMSIWRNFWIN